MSIQTAPLVDENGNPIPGADWASSPPGTPPPWLTPTVGGIPAPMVDAAASAPIAPPVAPPSEATAPIFGLPGGSVADSPWADHSQDPIGPSDLGAPVKTDAASTLPANANTSGDLGTAVPQPSAPWDTAAVNAPTIGEQSPTQKAAIQASADAIEDSEIQKAAEEKSKLPPDVLAGIQGLEDSRAALHAKTRLYDEQHADFLRAKENYETHIEAIQKTQKDSDEMVANAKALAAQKIDPNHWRSSRTTTQALSGWVAAIAGGLNAVNTGGRNLGLDYIDKLINQDVEAQTANLANQWKGIEATKEGIASTTARDAEIFKARETLRLANWEDVKNQLTTEQAKYDYKGRTATEIALKIKDAKAKMDAITAAANQKMFENNITLRTAERDDRKAKEEERSHKATEASANYGHWLTGQAQKETARHNLVTEGEEKAKDTAVVAKQTGEEYRKYGIPGITGKDGTVKTVVAPNISDTAAEELRDKIGKTRAVVALIDKVANERTGWSSNMANSPENQQLKGDAAKLMFALKEIYKVKNITDIDKDLFEDMRGFDDPTRRKSFRAGLLNFRNNTLSDVNADLQSHDIDGKLDIPRYEKAAPDDIDNAASFSGVDANGGVPGLGMIVPAASTIAKSVVPEAQVDVINGLVLRYQSETPANQARILATLTELSKSARSDEAKSAAEQAVTGLKIAGRSGGSPYAVRQGMGGFAGGLEGKPTGDE